MNKKPKLEPLHSDFKKSPRFALIDLVANKFEKIKQDKPANEVPDILPFNFFEGSSNKIPKNKSILLWGENINSKRIRTGYGILLRLEKILGFNLGFFKKALFKFIYYTPFKVVIKLFPKSCNIVQKLENNELKNVFMIIPNNNKGPNIFNLPCFISNKSYMENLKNRKLLPQPTIKKFCCIVSSNPSALDRIHFALNLSKYKKVDIFGATSHTNSDNSKLPNTFKENPQFFQQYKFVICFENSFTKEYITEKLPNAMLGNTVPIYRGAPNVGDYFNTSSFINYENYNSSYSKMIEKIIDLDQDDKKYTEFLNQPFMAEQNQTTINNKVKELNLFLERVME